MPDSDIQRLVERMAPTAIYVQWSDDGQHIRKWSHEPFDGSTTFVPADTITALRAEVVRMRDALERIVDAPMIDHANPERGAQAIARAALSSIMEVKDARKTT